MDQRILVDAREFVRGRRTGIGRVLEGLIDALAESGIVEEIVLGLSSEGQVPLKLENGKRIKTIRLPEAFVRSEKALSRLTKQGFSIFISPYPKLPLFNCHCKAVHTVHDVLDLTHPVYKGRVKHVFRKLRLKLALHKATLTWYDSFWSLEETKRYVGFVGKNPKVRYPGLGERFHIGLKEGNHHLLKQYQLQPGYILVVGNGMPHKNLGVLLKISDQIPRQLVFVGVSEKNREYWRSSCANAKALWITHVAEEDLPRIISQAFCLAQPSIAEGYGYPPLEAMACGVPAVVSNIPVLVETTGGNAMLADPSDSTHWRKAFEALEEKTIYEEEIEKGLAWVEPLRGQNAWKKHVSDIEELMRGF